MSLIYEVDYGNVKSWDGTTTYLLDPKGERNEDTFAFIFNTSGTTSATTGYEYVGTALYNQGTDSLLAYVNNPPTLIISEWSLNMTVNVTTQNNDYNEEIFVQGQTQLGFVDQEIHVIKRQNTMDLLIQYTKDDDTIGSALFTDYFLDQEYNWVTLGVTINFNNNYIAIYKNGELFDDYLDTSGVNMKKSNSNDEFYRWSSVGGDIDEISGTSLNAWSGYVQTVATWDEELTADDMLANYEAREYRFREDELVISNSGINGSVEDYTITMIGTLNAHLKIEYGTGDSVNSQFTTTQFFTNTHTGTSTTLTSIRGQLGYIYGFQMANSIANRLMTYSQTNKLASFPKLRSLSTFLTNRNLMYDFVYLTTEKTNWVSFRVDTFGRNYQLDDLDRLTTLTTLTLGYAGNGLSNVNGTLNAWPPVLVTFVCQSCSGLTMTPDLLMPNSMDDFVISGQLDTSYDVTRLIEKINGISVRRTTFTDIVGEPPTSQIYGNLADWPTLPESWYIYLQAQNTLSGDVATFLNRTYTTISNMSVFGNNTISGDISLVNWSGKVLNDAFLVAGSNTISGAVSTSLVKFPTANLFQVDGNNTISGDLAYLTNLKQIVCQGFNTINTYTSGQIWRADSTLIRIKGLVGSGNQFSTGDTDNLLIDIWAAKDGVPNTAITIDIYSAGRTAASDTAFNGLIGLGSVITLTPNP